MKKVFFKVFEASWKKCTGLTAGLFLTAVMVIPVWAADFQVQPTTMDLGSNVRSGVFSVINNGKEKINFQISVKEWNQDEAGKDVYTDTREIVFFPSVMTVEGNEQRAVRIGLKAPPSAREKTYRLFVEEIPAPKKTPDVKIAGKVQAGLNIAFRFAMPIFVKPVSPRESYIVEKVSMSGGVVRAMVRNTGNVHVKLRALKFSGKTADGKDLYSREVAGWYILNGLSLPYEGEVPKDVCGKLATMEVNALTETGSVNGTMNVQKSMCAQ